MLKAKQIYDYIDTVASFSLQEEWDNSGFLIGDENAEVSKVMLALDCTEAVIEQAKNDGCQLIVTHHPIIFKAVKSVESSSEIYKAVKYGISVICTHTCYDVANEGVSDILARTLGAEDIKKSPSGILSYGKIPKTTVADFAKQVKEKLSANVRFCNAEKEIDTVAFCGGAGSDYIKEAKLCGAGLLVTGDAGHHDFLDALNCGTALIAAGHFETEVISVKPLADKLKNAFPNTEFKVFDEKSPIEYI